MGDTQSSQGVPEEEQQQATTTKPWNPDDISETSGEDETTAIKKKPVTTQPKPPDPPPSTQKSKRRGKRRSSNSSASRDESGHDELAKDVPADKSSNPSLNSLSPPRSTQKSDETRSSRRRSGRKNKFEVVGDELLYPQLDIENTEVTAISDSEGPQELEAETEPVPDETETPSKPLQVRLKTHPTRYPCPQADAFKCEKTFATEASAKRHSQIHTHKYGHECTVCSNTYSRADKLRTHRLIHTEEELQEADQRARNQQEETGSEDKTEADATPTSPRNEAPQADLTTPDEAPEALSQVQGNADTNTPVAINTVDQSSTKTSTSAASVFDEPDATEVVEETPRPKSRLKRKRPASIVQSSNASTAESSRKRRRRNAFSPPTSVTSDEEARNAKEKEANDHLGTLSFDLPTVSKPKITKPGNLDNFAKPWIPGSKLHHPIHNPHSPRFGSSQQVRVIIPHSSNGGPSTNPTEKGSKQLQKLVSDESDVENTPLAKKGKTAVYTSPKGKRKAEKGVRYSSPPQEQADDHESDFESEVMATSVAHKGDSGRKTLKRKSSTATSSTTKAPRLKAKSNDDDDDEDEGRKGQFSDAEIDKLNRWRDMFCDDEDINIATFNQMMTDSCRRGKIHHWPYRIKKNDFMKQYMEVLPSRDKRSMQRFRERHFQNVPDKQEWSAEDDQELAELVEELGQKWVEIGQRMTRTQDSVSQRWRFKVQYGDSLHEGEWLASEEGKLREAFAQVKQELGLQPDPMKTELPFTWTSVSAKLKGKRTARQCANKWRLMYHKRIGNKFVKSETDGPAGASSKTATPSKMSQRLAGQTPSKSQPSSKKKKIVSTERVVDSEDDRDNEEEERADSANESSEGETVSEKATRKARRNPLASQTPQSSGSLSQVFAQTQANTSALRAPTTSRKRHTQTEMPTPGIPIQHRPASSPLRSIKSGNLDPDTAEDTQPAKSKPQNQQEDTDAIMADPESTAEDSDESTQSEEASQEDLVDDEASKSASEESSEETSSGASSGDEMVQSTQKDSFLASLRSPSNRSSFSSRPDKRASQGQSQAKIDWESVLRGEMAGDSDTDTDGDEGDIMHH